MVDKYIKGLEDKIKELEKYINTPGIRFNRNIIEDAETLQIGKEITLVEDISKTIIKDVTKPDNLLIEGNNLYTLQYLKKDYTSRIDIIEIDVPYNTQRKDMKYNDNFTNGKDVHSNWLGFINKRLVLAKDLLTDEGIIFIHIDDREIANLTLLCNEVFGEKNKLGCIVWTQNPGGNNSAKHLSNVKEYVLVYAKDKSKSKAFKGKRIPLDINDYKLSDKDGNYFKSDSFEKTGNKPHIRKHKKGHAITDTNPAKVLYAKKQSLEETSQMDTVIEKLGCGYSIYYNLETKDVILRDETYYVTEDVLDIDDKPDNDLIDKGYVRVIPRYRPDGKRGCWRISAKEFLKRLDDNIIMIDKNNEGSYMFYNKEYYGDGYKYIKYKDLQTDHCNQTAAKDIIDMFGTKVFDFTKPVSLIKELISLVDNKDAMILDFFAGSGTVGKAVLELNDEDDGNRCFILSTINENKICEEVTYERLKRCINGYTGVKSKKVYKPLVANLRYFKIELTDE